MPQKSTFFYPKLPSAVSLSSTAMTDWLEHRAAPRVEDVARVLAELPPPRAEREPVVGAGEGGDETTAIDATPSGR